MATYDKMTSLKNPGRSVQVESAIRDGSGKNIENNYAKQNGYYSTLKTGNADLADFADNLTPYGPNSGIEDDTPFVFQTSGGESDIGSSAQIKKLEGTSKAWNQNALPLNSNKWNASSAYGTLSNATETSVLYTRNQSEQTNNVSLIYQAIDGGYGSIAGHKYLIKTIITPSATFKFRAYIGTYGNVYYPTANVKNYFAEIITANLAGYIQFISENGGHLPLGGTILFENIQCFDLTLIYGAGNEPTTVDEFEKDFPLPYYPYDAGSIVSSKVKGYKVVGYNAWDEEWEQGYINVNGNPGSAQKLRSKNFTRVIAGQNYSFYCSILVNFNIFYYDANKNFISSTTKTNSASNREAIIEIPENVSYIKFYLSSEYGNGTFYNNDIAIHLTWDGSKTGYEPYWSETYQFPNVELRAVNDIKDELLPDGTVTRRIGIVDLGSLSWEYKSSNGTMQANISNAKYIGEYYQPSNILCSKYLAVSAGVIEGGSPSDKSIGLESNGTKIRVRDSAYTDAATFKTAMSGVYLIYELATPTTEQVDPYTENTLIDDWGTQEWLSDNTIMLPQPAEFFYSVDYKAFIDSLGGREDIDYAAENIVSQEQLTDVVEGRRPVASSQLADNLTPYSEESGSTGTNPFVFQSAGGSSDIGSQAYLKALRGNSIAWNQLGKHTASSETINGITFTNNGDGSWTVSGTASANTNKVVFYIDNSNKIVGHKYLLKGCPSGGSSSTYFLYNGYGYSEYCDTGDGKIFSCSDVAYVSSIQIRIASGTAILTPIKFFPQLFDLTEIFGAGNEPTTALEFNRLFPNTYYEYNVGELKSCKVSKVVNVGYNQFNKSDVSLRYNSVYIDSSGYINVGGTNYSLVLPIIAGQKYTVERKTKISARFRIATCPNIPTELYRAPHSAMDNDALSLTVQSGAEDRYLVINLSTNETEFLNQLENLCVHLTWDNSRTGYEPYEKHEYNLPNVELKGGYDNQGNHWGDSLYPDGTLETGSGLMEFDGSTEKGVDTNSGTSGVFRTIGDYTQFYLQSSQFVSPEEHQNDAYPEYAKGTIIVQKVNVEATGVVIHYYSNVKWILLTLPTATASTASEANTWLSNNKVSIIYAKQHTTTQDDAYKYQEITPIDDFGTQEFLYDSDIAIPVPQGNEFFYPVDYKAFIDSLGGREDINYSADEIVSHEELNAELVIREQLKEALGGTLRQLLAVKANIDFDNTAVVDLGELGNWSKANNGGNPYFVSNSLGDLMATSGQNLLCSIYKTLVDASAENTKPRIYRSNATDIIVFDSSRSSMTAVEFKQSLKGVLLAYEKASS